MTMKSQPKAAGAAASQLISDRIAELGDWRGKTLARVRALIKDADPEILEEVLHAAFVANESETLVDE